MSDANDMRKHLEALNERAPEPAYKGKHASDPNISYDTESKGGQIHKVIANLKADPSGRYTKLGRNLLRMERIKARMDAIKEEVKQDSRELIADLFNAEDAIYTREVETISFIFMMTKDPAVTKSPKYKDILEELTKHMTPELIAMKEKLLKTMITETQKAPAIRVAKDKAEESLDEGLADAWKSIKAACRKFFTGVLNWGKDYDARLDMLKGQFAMSEAVVGQPDGMDTHRGAADIHWGKLFSKGFDKLTKKKEKTAYDQAQQRRDNKSYKDRMDGVKEETLAENNPLREGAEEDPRITGQEISYRGWVIGFDEDMYKWTREGYYCHVEGWEPGDPDGEDGTRSTAGYYSFGSIQACKDQIDDELDGEPLVKEDGDWYDQDDFQTYNDNEADDYRNEGGDDDLQTYDPEGAISAAMEMLGVAAGPENAQAMQELAHELGRYSDVYSISPSRESDDVWEFDCADEDSVNYNYNPMATAWVENGRLKWKS